MSPEQKRKFNTTFGISFIMIGLLAWAGAVYMIYKPNDPIVIEAYKQEVDSSTCVATLSRMGYSNVQATGPSISVESLVDFTSESKIKYQLQEASTAIAACHAKLKYFCIGAKCKNPNSISMILDVSQ